MTNAQWRGPRTASPQAQSAQSGQYREAHHHPAAGPRQVPQPAPQPVQQRVQYPSYPEQDYPDHGASHTAPHMGYRQEPPVMQPRAQPDPQAQQYQQAQAQAPRGPAPYGQPAPRAPQHGYAPQHSYAPRQGSDEQQYYATAEGAPHDAAGAVSRAMNGAGAVLSIALVAGLAVWGYQLAMRDVTEIPVVAALEGPMRIAPEDPGGANADHQGLAVNNVAAVGVAEGPASQVMLAPVAETLGEDDVPAIEASVNVSPNAEAGEMAPALEDTPTPVSLSGEDAERAAALALVDQIASGAAPLTGEEADLSMTPEAEEMALTAARDGFVDATVPGVAASPRPRARPFDLVTRAAAQPSTDALLAATQIATAEVNAADIPTGTRLVQLGAYDSEDVARSEWDQLSGKFADYMGGKSRVIEQAQSGGKTFYRLRAMGFDDLSDARRFCAALMAVNAACIPVVTR